MTEIVAERFIPDELIDEAVDAIINSRDFCGDERQAVRDVAADAGFSSQWRKLHRIANFRANARWNGFKKAAGVNAKHCW